MFKSISIKDLSPADVQNFLQHAIVPRPICFASTIDKSGSVNLSPFSFFNLFSSNPPIVVFSPCRRVRDNTTKHTLDNIQEVAEVAINIVSFEMVQQASLSSCEYPRGQNEFVKAGFIEEPSILIKPPRVRESPIQMECVVNKIISLGTDGGAGNLILAEVLLMHVNESILNDKGYIDQKKMDVVSRLGGNWYARINAETMFQVEKPNQRLGIGIDQLPDNIRNSEILTGNNLGMLANVDCLPVIDPAFDDEVVKSIFQYYSLSPEAMDGELHSYAKKLLDEGKVIEAWQVLLVI